MRDGEREEHLHRLGQRGLASAGGDRRQHDGDEGDECRQRGPRGQACQVGGCRARATDRDEGRRTRFLLEQPREVARPVPQAEPQAEGHEGRQHERRRREHPEVADGAAHAVAPRGPHGQQGGDEPGGDQAGTGGRVGEQVAQGGGECGRDVEQGPVRAAQRQQQRARAGDADGEHGDPARGPAPGRTGHLGLPGHEVSQAQGQHPEQGREPDDHQGHPGEHGRGGVRRQHHRHRPPEQPGRQHVVQRAMGETQEQAGCGHAEHERPGRGPRRGAGARGHQHRDRDAGEQRAAREPGRTGQAGSGRIRTTLNKKMRVGHESIHVTCVAVT